MPSPVTSKAALLQALVDGPNFGLALIEQIKNKTRGELKLNQGSIYPALRSLEREGLLRSWDQDGPPERAGRPRRYYELTAEGRKAAFRAQRIFSAFPLVPALGGAGNDH